MKETIYIKVNNRIKDVKRLFQTTPKIILENESSIDFINVGDIFTDVFWRYLKELIDENPRLLRFWEEYEDKEIVDLIKQKISDI